MLKYKKNLQSQLPKKYKIAFAKVKQIVMAFESGDTMKYKTAKIQEAAILMDIPHFKARIYFIHCFKGCYNVSQRITWFILRRKLNITLPSESEHWNLYKKL